MSGLIGKHVPVSADNPSILRLEDRCVDCGHCLAACAESIGPARRWLDGAPFSCINCGQCVAVCPEQALVVKPQIEQVKAAIRDPQKIVVFSTSPSVRVALGDAFGFPPGAFVDRKSGG